MTHLMAELEPNRPTHTVEDYLMNMHVMERDHGEIVAARLAELLGVSPATVAMTLKRMERDHWITGKSRKESIHLTELGRAAAHSVTRRHMLIEWLLVKILRVPFLQIHAEAHNLEHAISTQLEERLLEILDSPKVCPHGNPFPGCEEATRHLIPLTDVAVGKQVLIRRIHEFAENNQELLKFLFENGILPGVEASVGNKLAFNQTMTLIVNDRAVILGFAVAHYLFAEEI
jgi:DtxR family Mn-dependent transcriptional regulator